MCDRLCRCRCSRDVNLFDLCPFLGEFPRRATADEDIKVPSAENPGAIKGSFLLSPEQVKN